MVKPSLILEHTDILRVFKSENSILQKIFLVMSNYKVKNITMPKKINKNRTFKIIVKCSLVSEIRRYSDNL